MVWSTTASSSVERVSRSIWSRRRVENAWMVVAVLYLRRLKRRSTACWMRRRGGYGQGGAGHRPAGGALPDAAEQLPQRQHRAGVAQAQDRGQGCIDQGAVDQPVDVV